MHKVGRIGTIGLGIALACYLSGAPVFAGEQPPRPAAVDGSKITITSPKDGDKVNDSFELKYELIKGSQVTHVHVYVDDEYQRGFSGVLKGLSKGTHEITVKAAMKNHSLAPPMDTITVEVE
ncbi:MAG TPA: hypothetical protein VLL06_00505 [Nitrospiraceae bacterium]|nr:hypothetical protein [Nitrospiraceae bacterium]